MVSKGLLPVLMMLTMSVTLLAACGSPDPTSTPTPGGSAGGPTPTAGPVGFQAEWEALIAAAQKEGRLIVAGGNGSEDLLDSIMPIFEEKFGIRTTIARGGGREQVDRMLAEQGAGRYEVDMMQAGQTSTLERSLPAELIEPIPPYLFHPEVIDGSLWYEGKLKYLDTQQQYALMYCASLTSPEGAGFDLYYNVNLVSQAEIAALETPWDLIDPKWKGQVTSTDVSLGTGSTGDLIMFYTTPDLGKDWLRAWFIDMEPDIFRESTFIEDGLVFGKYAWSLMPGSTDLDTLRDAGAPISDMFPKPLVFQEVLGGTFSRCGFSIPNNPPHPNALKLWLNWLLSREGQTAMHETLAPREAGPHNRISLRDDGIPVGLTDPVLRRELGRPYVWDPDFDLEFRTVRAEVFEYMKELFAERFAP